MFKNCVLMMDENTEASFAYEYTVSANAIQLDAMYE